MINVNNKETKKISIIIPVYNAEKYLDKCVNSLLNQTYSNLEIILVDDGSKDNSPAICDKFKAQDSRVFVIHKPNGGACSARNAGLKLANGEFIAFIDADDWCEKNMYEILVKNMDDTSSDISICGVKFFDSVNSQPIKKQKKETIETYTNIECMKHMFGSSKFTGTVWNKLYKKEIMFDILFKEDLPFMEDFDFVYEYLKKCKKAVYTNLKLYHYVKTPASLVRSVFKETRLYVISVLEDIVKDAEINYPEIVNCAKALLSLLSVELYYYTIRDKYRNVEVKRMIRKTHYDNLKYLRGNKYFKPLFRTWSHFGFCLLSIGDIDNYILHKSTSKQAKMH